MTTKIGVTKAAMRIMDEVVERWVRTRGQLAERNVLVRLTAEHELRVAVYAKEIDVMFVTKDNPLYDRLIAACSLMEGWAWHHVTVLDTEEWDAISNQE